MVSDYRAFKRICFRQKQRLRTLNTRATQLYKCYYQEPELFEKSSEFHLIWPFISALSICSGRLKSKVEATIRRLVLSEANYVKANQIMLEHYRVANELMDKFCGFLTPFAHLHQNCGECSNLKKNLLSGQALNGLFARKKRRIRDRTQKLAKAAIGKANLKCAKVAPLCGKRLTKPTGELRRNAKLNRPRSINNISAPNHRLFHYTDATPPTLAAFEMPDSCDYYQTATTCAYNRWCLGSPARCLAMIRQRVFHRWKRKEFRRSQSSADW